MSNRIRVEVVSAAGMVLGEANGEVLVAADPPEAQQQRGQLGWMERKPCPALGDRLNPCIELDNGDIIWGYQCWWVPVTEENVAS